MQRGVELCSKEPKDSEVCGMLAQWCVFTMRPDRIRTDDVAVCPKKTIKRYPSMRLDELWFGEGDGWRGKLSVELPWGDTLGYCSLCGVPASLCKRLA